MHLANDYIYPYRAFRSSYSQCRIRIYVPDGKADAAVVVYLQLPTNPGTSTTNAARIVAGECTALPKASAPLPQPQKKRQSASAVSPWRCSL